LSTADLETAEELYDDLRLHGRRHQAATLRALIDEVRVSRKVIAAIRVDVHPISYQIANAITEYDEL
jgi:hypothetical protein